MPDVPVSVTYSADSPPGTSAESAVLADGEGNLLYGKQADRRMPMASTTKIMTALVAIRENEDPDRVVSIPKEAIGVEGSSIYLYEGERLTMRELLYAVLMESANDAATAVAIATSGSLSAFADRMNETAAELGLSDTHFVNPHGLDTEDHYTTAADLARLAAVAMQDKTFAEMVSTYKKEIPLRDGEGIRLLVNHNRLLKQLEGCIGVKTGYTRTSGRCLVSAVEREGTRLICVTLNAPDDWNDHTALHEWGFSLYETVTLSAVGEQFAVIPVVGGITDAAGNGPTVTVKNTEALRVLLLRGGQNITKKTELPGFLYAPVEAGAVLGQVHYYNGSTHLGSLPLYAGESVPLYEKPSLWKRLLAFFGV